MDEREQRRLLTGFYFIFIARLASWRKEQCLKQEQEQRQKPRADPDGRTCFRVGTIPGCYRENDPLDRVI